MNMPLVIGWQFDPVLIGTLFTAALCYGLALGPLRTRLAPGVPLPRARVLVFYLTLGITFLAEGSPLHDLAERYLLSAHMVQHLLLSYLVPPLLIWSVPPWLWRAVLLNPVIKPVAQILTKPLIAFLLFNLFFSIWHMPVIYDMALRNSTLHHLEHVLFVGVSLLLWWPLLSPLKELPRLSYGWQLLYMFLIPVAQLPAFGAITFADYVLYPTYEHAPHVFFSSALADQALGGVIMKIGSVLTFAPPFVIVFFNWFRDESGHGTRPQPSAERHDILKSSEA